MTLSRWTWKRRRRLRPHYREPSQGTKTEAAPARGRTIDRAAWWRRLCVVVLLSPVAARHPAAAAAAAASAGRRR